MLALHWAGVLVVGPHHCKPHIHAVSRLLVLIKLFGLIKLLNLIEVSICIWSDYIILNRNNWATYSPRNNHNKKCKVFYLGFFWPYLHNFLTISFLIKLQAPCLKKRLWHRYFSVNFVKFLRTPFSQNTYWRLLLTKIIINCKILKKKSCDWAQHGLLRWSSLVKAEEFKCSKRDYTQPQFWSNGGRYLGIIQPLLLIPAF